MYKHSRRFIALLCAYVMLVGPHMHACCIMGYQGDMPCKAIIKEGLERGQYRGYDSAGVAFLQQGTGELVSIRAAGQLKNLIDKLDKTPIDGCVGIGHTRWATHGGATEANAHPHTDCHADIAVVHNGIIENYYALKQQLILEGHTFTSETDTEIIAHIVERELTRTTDMHAAVQSVMAQLQGTYGSLIMLRSHPDTLIALRRGSPMCIGLGNGQTYVASDFLSFAGKTNQVVFMPEGSYALITRQGVDLRSTDGSVLYPEVKTIDVQPSVYEKFGHDHFMLKEIYEQPTVIKTLVSKYRALGADVWRNLGISPEQVRDLKRIHLLACGTSWHAGRIAQFFFENVCKIPVQVHIASEFRYMPFFPEDDSLYIAISQSGETADTLEAIRMIKEYKQPIITITNVPTSTMVRETNGHMPLHAGPEIAVASTKAFSAQLSSLYWLAHYFALEKGLIAPERLYEAEQELLQAAQVLEDAMETYKIDIIQKHAKKYAQAKKFMFLGRHVGYPFALEAALKLKEISYIFAQGYPAGELKHGSIALVDAETPIMLFSSLDPVLYHKLVSNAQEVKARKGHLLSVVFEHQQELVKVSDVVFVIPRVAPLLEPLAMTGLMQFFVYQIAKELGCDIDKPRNLAKAVTVE